MPNLVDEEIINVFMQNMIRLTGNFTLEQEQYSQNECDIYLNNKSTDICNLKPLSVYYILSKLQEEEQIKFLRDNIDYIRKNDDNIFLYNLCAPKSLSYYFSFNVMKEIYKLDKNIFRKMLNGNVENFVAQFSDNDIIEFCNDFSFEINQMENRSFVDIIYFCNNNIFHSIEDINEKSKATEKFSYFILNTYREKILTLNSNDFFIFLDYIDSEDILKKVLYDYKSKIIESIKESKCESIVHLIEDLLTKQIFFCMFYNELVEKFGIKDIIKYLTIDTVIFIYNKNKEIFKDLNITDFFNVKIDFKYFFEMNYNYELPQEFIKILDNYEINNIEKMFSIAYNFTYDSTYEKFIILKYLEKKFRNNIKITGNIKEIDEETSIFSEKYINNLKELNYLLKNKIITKQDSNYKNHLIVFIIYLIKKNIIDEIDDEIIKKIQVLFYKIVKGESLTILLKIHNIKDIALYNRIGDVKFSTSGFNIHQIEKYNVKNHKSLCKNTNYALEKNLKLKLMFLVGYDNALKMLSKNYSLTVLEHLVGNVDVSKVELDKDGNPILNKKIMNLLFNDKKLIKINNMLEDSDSELYKYFPRIFNDFEVIKMNGKDKSLKEILEFLKSCDVSLPIKYFRLKGQFKHIGCNEEKVIETLKLHDIMLKRIGSTIPKIKGQKDNYTYEILDLCDMDNLSIGNKTNCCFTINGAAYSSLIHAVSSINGRILVVRKDSNLVSHSWIFRNGNTLCLDSIETFEGIKDIDFLDIYLKFADDIVKKCEEKEQECGIKNITIGFPNFSKKIIGIENYKKLIKNNAYQNELISNSVIIDELPKPIEDVKYLDSKNVQYLIKGKGDFKFYQSEVLYQDPRNEVLYFNKDKDYDDNYLELINNKINCLRYIKHEEEQKIKNFKEIDIQSCQEIFGNDDWYIIFDKDGNMETYINSEDERAKLEMKNYEKQEQKHMCRVLK